MKSSNPIGAVEIEDLRIQARTLRTIVELFLPHIAEVGSGVESESLIECATRKLRELASERARRIAARAEERAYIVKMIRENATDITFFAKGRALDLLAWILELPPPPDSVKP